VKLAFDTTTEDDTPIALKIMNESKPGEVEQMELMNTELDMMDRLEHKHIVNQKDYGEAWYKKKNAERRVKFIALEICQGGELFDFICHGGAFSEPVARHFFKQFMEGLKHCHDTGITHRDLKPENLLLTSDFDLKIADFGFASMIEKNQDGMLTTFLGTPAYMSPEQN
jgi:serine/threonine protein kinase